MTLSSKPNTVKTQPNKKLRLKYSEVETDALIDYLATLEAKLDQQQNQIDELSNDVSKLKGGN